VAPLESCPNVGPPALVLLKGDLTAEGTIGSTMGDRPDRFRLSEPSARDDGPIMAMAIDGVVGLVLFCQ